MATESKQSSVNNTPMQLVEQRAHQVDTKLKNLTQSMSTLQTAIKGQKGNNKKGKSRGTDGPGLSKADTLLILSRLKSLRAKVLRYEEERNREKQCFQTMREQMRTELLELKKEVMADHLRQTPQEFRKYLESQLLSVREELLKADAVPKQSEMKEPDMTVLEKVRSELIEIRKEMALKLEELDSHRAYQREMDQYKRMLTNKLKLLRSEVAKQDEEMQRLRAENEQFRSGQRVPKLMQDTLISKLSVLKEEVFQVETENKHFKMQLGGKDPLLMVPKSMYVNTVEMHTGGEPLRIVENGIPKLEGATLLEKRQHMMREYDYYRKFLMLEPRGHCEMYGCLITEPDNRKDADFAVLFMHNEGYSSMCGHAIIALGRYAVDFGIIEPLQNGDDEKADHKKKDNRSVIRIQCPCGIVTVSVEIDPKTGKSTGNVSFVSAPGWAEYTSTSIQLEQFGRVEIDIGYGGTYYAICPATRFNLSVRDSPIEDLVNIATLIKNTVIKKMQLSHPDSRDLQYLYGVILTDANNSADQATANITVFADRQVDRSPTGSGVIARMAVDFAKKNIKEGQTRSFIGKTGAVFEGQIVKTMDYKDKKNAVIVNVSGSAKYVGRSQFCLEEGDDLGRGFLLR